MEEKWSFTTEWWEDYRREREDWWRERWREWREPYWRRERRYNDWYLKFDNDFARIFLLGLPFRPPPSTIQLCSCCSAIVSEVHTVPAYTVSISDIRTSAENCSICKFLLQAFQRFLRDDDGNIHINRSPSALRVGPGGPRILRVCAGPECAVRADSKIPIGRPPIAEHNNPARLALLRAWLRQCDGTHDCNKHQIESELTLPTRVLYVGDYKDSGYDSDFVRLVCASETRKQEYIALSHCWGGLSDDEKEKYCTTQDNIGRRLRGFSLSKLPRTFQDAVKVTRELGVLYLWIDSLCIIQYGDNGEDWKHESGRMESVFSYAYCTIAATAAIDSNSGFLDCGISTEYVYVQNASGEQFYISTDIDDFDNDVGKAQLNTRAWVMQEGVLARRTIHFSANQIYWECGEGVYCENLIQLECPPTNRYFTLDPNFPKRLLQSGRRRTLDCISFLFQEYSKRNLTVPNDRYVAISGLVDRIADALNSRSRYGIFEKYLHRNLLWHASNDKMKEIAYDFHMPSWSWMAYSGGIRFMDIPLGKVDWIDSLRFDADCESILIADVGKFQNCIIKPAGDHYSIFNFFRMKRGWIRYDVEEGKNLREERCVVVGRKADKDVMKYYILVVRPTDVDGEYSRVGVGLIRSDRVVKERVGVRVV